MTVDELMVIVADEKPNQYDYGKYIEWLNDLEGRIFVELFPEEEFIHIYEDDLERELKVKEPYANLYKYYIFSMIDFANQEMDRYGNSSAMFNRAYQEYANYVNRTYDRRKSVLGVW